MDPGGTVTVAKTFSTPGDFTTGVIDAVRLAAGDLQMDLKTLLAEARLFLHATTIADNAVITGNLTRAGILVTHGFEDTLRMMRGGYAEWSGLPEHEIKNIPFVKKPEPIIPRELVRGVRERVDASGTTLVGLDEAEVRAAVVDLRAQGVEAIGVSFLWSFLNPENENACATVIKDAAPDIFMTLSHEVAPVIGEFERTQSVGLNSRIGPAVARYLAELEKRVADEGFAGKPLIMQAYGGLLHPDAAAKTAIGLIESGPVSGLVGCKALGNALGFRDIIGVDMGGTTFKAGVISDGTIDYAREPMVARYHYASPKMNVESIGVAGGSIVALEEATLVPMVGPSSAGADPGPVCYDRGGDRPTVTDVDLLLGYLDERFFLGGRARLNRAKAEAAFAREIADPLGMDVIDAAGEVYRLTNSLIYDMLHKLTVERGLDPREYVIFSYGGTAGMHVGAFAPPLGVKRVVVPSSASVHGALGLVTSDVVYEEQLSRPLRMPVAPDDINTILERLMQQGQERLLLDGFSADEIVFSLALDMRYRRQVHVVTTPVDAQPLDAADVEDVLHRFERLYEQRFGPGSGYQEAGVELVNFRVRGTGVLAKPELQPEPRGDGTATRAFVEEREAYIGSARAVLTVQCFDFERMAPADAIDGPALIWTPTTTVVINEGQTATCDEYKSLQLTWTP